MKRLLLKKSFILKVATVNIFNYCTMVIFKTSLNVNTQLPLDSKTYVYDFTDLLDLGLNQTKAFTYYIGMKVYCASNESTYIWREYTTPLEAGALIPNGYTYPPGILNDTFD